MTGENQVQLAIDSGAGRPIGRIYWAAISNVQCAPAEGDIPTLESHARSITIEREYRLRRGQEPLSEFQQGELVEVQLTLPVDLR